MFIKTGIHSLSTRITVTNWRFQYCDLDTYLTNINESYGKMFRFKYLYTQAFMTDLEKGRPQHLDVVVLPF